MGGGGGETVENNLHHDLALHPNLEYLPHLEYPEEGEEGKEGRKLKIHQNSVKLSYLLSYFSFGTRLTIQTNITLDVDQS